MRRITARTRKALAKYCAPFALALALVVGWASAAYAVPSQDGNANFQAGNSVTSLTFSGLATAAGDTQVVTICNQTGTVETITKPSNFTQIATDDTSGFGNITTFIATSSLAAGPSFSWGTAAGSTGVAIVLKGSNGVVDVNSAGPAASLNSGNTSNATAVTPTAANDYFMAMFCRNDANSVVTPPSGFTEIVPTGGVTSPNLLASERAYFLVNPALSSQQPGIVWSSTGFYNGQVAYVVVKTTVGGCTGSIGNGANAGGTIGNGPATTIGNGGVTGGTQGNGGAC